MSAIFRGPDSRFALSGWWRTFAAFCAFARAAARCSRLAWRIASISGCVHPPPRAARKLPRMAGQIALNSVGDAPIMAASRFSSFGSFPCIHAKHMRSIKAPRSASVRLRVAATWSEGNSFSQGRGEMSATRYTRDRRVRPFMGFVSVGTWSGETRRDAIQASTSARR